MPPKGLLENTAKAYFDYGVLGITVVVLLIVTGLLVWYILKDKKSDKELGEAIKKTADNQKEFIVMYQESQKQHKEIVALLNETLEVERANTKECYIGVANKMDKLHNNLELLLQLQKK